MKKPACPACGGERRSLKVYLCEDCWWLLIPAARTALKRRDNMATARVIELRRQLAAGVPLEGVRVTP